MGTPSGRFASESPLRLRRLSGFSLIELLVVLAVTAILVSIVTKTIGIARDASNKAHNVSNLKSLMNGWQLYAADNGGYFPIGLTWEGGVTNPPNIGQLKYRYWWRWYGGIAEYMPSLVVQDTEAERNYNGPVAPGWGNVWQGWFPPGTIERAREIGTPHVGYHFNRYVGDHRRTFTGTMQNSSKTPVLFAYWDDAGGNPLGQYFSSPISGDPNRANFMRVGSRSMGGGNHFAFADGHVEWVPALETPQEYEERMQWRP